LIFPESLSSTFWHAEHQCHLTGSKLYCQVSGTTYQSQSMNGTPGSCTCDLRLHHTTVPLS